MFLGRPDRQTDRSCDIGHMEQLDKRTDRSCWLEPGLCAWDGRTDKSTAELQGRQTLLADR
jgi:hypothetical protein